MKTRFTANASINNVALVKSGSSISVDIFDLGAKLGRLEIGRGAITWTPKNSRTPIRIPWKKLSELMEAYNG
jgi:hypothetical protein